MKFNLLETLSLGDLKSFSWGGEVVTEFPWSGMYIEEGPERSRIILVKRVMKKFKHGNEPARMGAEVYFVSIHIEAVIEATHSSKSMVGDLEKMTPFGGPRFIM